MAARLGLLAGILFVEKLLLGNLVDARRARDSEGLGAFVHVAQHWGFRYLVTLLAAASLLTMVRERPTADPSPVANRLPEIRLSWMLVHFCLVAALAPLSFCLYRSAVTLPVAFAGTVALWIMACTAAIVTAAVGLVPRSIWVERMRSLGFGWLYAAFTALLATGAWLWSEKLWTSATAITFKLVTCILSPVLSELSADPATRVIATPRFAVEISEVCSGLEGLGLTLAFTLTWLIYFRREYVFPRALILIPLSLAAIFGLNVLRIATLILIGNAGYPEVASFGFHSQAGWIAFNGVACAMVYFSRRSTWLNWNSVTAGKDTEIHNPTATYLVPLLAMLAAGTMSRALSGRFETFYAFRLIAAAAALLAFREPLLAMRWQWSWRGPAVGIGVFLLWIGAAHWLLPTSPPPDSLSLMPMINRLSWITGHCLTSVIFVPIVEELAYRGYLMRRLIQPHFETVRYRSVRWVALTVTAIAFGAAHGILWAPGIVAGLAYGLLAIRRDSLAEAVVAHATTNGLIAVTVVAANQWQLW